MLGLTVMDMEFVPKLWSCKWSFLWLLVDDVCFAFHN